VILNALRNVNDAVGSDRFSSGKKSSCAGRSFPGQAVFVSSELGLLSGLSPLQLTDVPLVLFAIYSIISYGMPIGASPLWRAGMRCGFQARGVGFRR
jgi:hypothetical protein